MSTNTKPAPEDVLLAVLHKVGSDARLVNDFSLASLFNEAAQTSPELLGTFAWHPQYHDSKVLRSTLQALDLGGTIIRENASIKNFRVAPRVAGEYGKKKFELLDAAEREVIERLAERIRQKFVTAAPVATA